MKFKFGGKIIRVKSRYGWWPHFLFEKDGHQYEYIPYVHKQDLILPPPLFRGYPIKLTQRTNYAI